MKRILTVFCAIIPLLSFNLSAMETNDLHSAISKDDITTVERIIKRPDIKLTINKQNQRGLTPLGFAAKKNSPEIIGLLVEGGADLEAKNAGDFTALGLATRGGHKATTEALLKKGAKANVQSASTKITPLHEAAKDGYLEIVELLINQKDGLKANVNATTTDLITPLHYAAEKGHPEVVKSLIGMGSDPNAKDTKGNTPLILSARWGNGKSAEVAQVLLEHKANINATANNGETALHAAARSSKPKTELVRLLLKNGANKNLRDKSKQTPAEATSHKEIRELLKA